MAIKNPHDLLVHDLAATYYSERTMLKGMNDMLKLAQSDRVKQMISNHIRESENQAKRVEQCFDELGESHHEVKCLVADCLVDDFKTVAKEIQDSSLIDLVILGAMDKVEHYEMAVYRGLVNKAKLMGHTRVAQILSQVESEEEKECQLVESAEQALGKVVIAKAQQGGTPRRPGIGI